MTLIIAYDLGTGGCKGSLFDSHGATLATSFHPYRTYYPKGNQHEQQPEDWWKAVVLSTRQLLETSQADPSAIECLALSGQSLAVVPLDRAGSLLRENVPIWSDTRPVDQTNEFFSSVNQDEWYQTTGSGFAPQTYSVFKVMWYRDNEPEMFERTTKIVGSKDYVNFRLTGQMLTDHSYASGSGVYDLRRGGYHAGYLAASGLKSELFPDIVPASHCLGTLSESAADETGLPRHTKVFCGGVDNSCMALGAGNTKEGAIYLSLGSSAWFAVSSTEPLIDLRVRPFVFAHVIPGMFTSATSIFSAGSSLRWVRDIVCSNYVRQAERVKEDVYDLIIRAGMTAPPGAKGLVFNPSLAGAPAAYPNPDIRGAFLGIELRHDQNDLIRAVLEGIALDLRVMYARLAELVELEETIQVVGGGSRSPQWIQMFADIFDRKFVTANIGQDAASLGAAAVAAVGHGIWPGFGEVQSVIETQRVFDPNKETARIYARLLPVYREALQILGDAAEILGTRQE